MKKDNTPLYISFGAIVFLLLALVLGIKNFSLIEEMPQNEPQGAEQASTHQAGNVPENNAPRQTNAQRPINENELARQRANDANWRYQSDGRPFDRRPNNTMASDLGWSVQNDMMVLVEPKSQKLAPFYIDAFEAFISDYRAWSVPDVYPTDKIKHTSAATACEAAGKRLCSVHEWRTACRGGSTNPVQFPKTDAILRYCDFARSGGYDRQDFVEKTDSHIACTPPGLSIYHMIGNVAEFVTTPNGQIMVVGLTYYDARIRDNQIALTNACERVVAGPGQYPASRYNKGTGFRCCKDAP